MWMWRSFNPFSPRCWRLRSWSNRRVGATRARWPHTFRLDGGAGPHLSTIGIIAPGLRPNRRSQMGRPVSSGEGTRSRTICWRHRSSFGHSNDCGSDSTVNAPGIFHPGLRAFPVIPNRLPKRFESVLAGERRKEFLQWLGSHKVSLSYDRLLEELIPAAVQEYESNRRIYGEDDFRDLANAVRSLAGLAPLA